MKLDNIPTKVSVNDGVVLQVNYRAPENQTRRPMSNIIPVIEEDKVLDMSKAHKFERNNSSRSEANPYRKTSRQDMHGRPNGIVNNGYLNTSQPSSIHGGSMSSLTVVREQNWVCSKWTRFERSLFLVVAIMMGIIIVLIITVGVMAAHKKHNKYLDAIFN